MPGRLSKLRWPAALLVVAAAATAAAVSRGSESQVRQPMAFNHKRHIEAKMDCLACHEQAGDYPAATLPLLAKCLECHDKPKGKSPDEPLIRQYAKQKTEIPWIQVNRMPGHVFFSHQAHVGFAEMECDACHGNMKDQVKPLTSPNVDLDMSACISCHQKKGAGVDCQACHK